jgi:YVTN family beta-propeller protein
MLPIPAPGSVSVIDTATNTVVDSIPVGLSPQAVAITPAPLPSNLPTLSQWGLIAMASILGIVGFMVMRRRRVTA